MKNYLTIIGIAIFLLFCSVEFFSLWRKEKDERNRLTKDIEVIKQKIQYFKDSSMAQTGVLQMTLNEVKRTYPSLENELKEQGIRLKNIEQYQHSIIDINAKFEAIIKQINDTTIISQYSNKWLKYVEKRNTKDTTSIVQMSMDVDLKQAIEKVRMEHFWNPFKGNFLKKELKQKIWTDNPYCTLKYNEIIKLQK